MGGLSGGLISLMDSTGFDLGWPQTPAVLDDPPRSCSPPPSKNLPEQTPKNCFSLWFPLPGPVLTLPHIWSGSPARILMARRKLPLRCSWCQGLMIAGCNSGAGWRCGGGLNAGPFAMPPKYLGITNRIYLLHPRIKPAKKYMCLSINDLRLNKRCSVYYWPGNAPNGLKGGV